MIGPNSRYDGHAVHCIGSEDDDPYPLHQDAEYDTREFGFDLMASIFPHDCPPEMGGTLLVPGSQFRRVHESNISRYQHILGEQQITCKAGTLIIWHHNLWHRGQPNRSGRPRIMFKLRLNPMVKQLRLWRSDDLVSSDRKVREILSQVIPWHGLEHRLELIHRVRLWRYLTGNTEFDLDNLYSTRTKNETNVRYLRSGEVWG